MQDATRQRTWWQHWHHVLYWAVLIVGAAYSLGILRANIISNTERILGSERALVEMSASMQVIRDHVSRLQWDRDMNNKTVTEIQIDVKTLLRSMLEQENRSKLLMDWLKPKQLTVEK